MTTVPQVQVTLDPQTGELVAELPGFMATRRRVTLQPVEAGATLLRILQAQLENRAEIGLDGAPTQAQVKHWEQHGVWKSQGCRFCQAEGTPADQGARRQGAKEAKRRLVLKRSDGVEVRRLKPGASAKHKTLQAKGTAEDLGL